MQTPVVLASSDKVLTIDTNLGDRNPSFTRCWESHPDAKRLNDKPS